MEGNDTGMHRATPISASSGRSPAVNTTSGVAVADGNGGVGGGRRSGPWSGQCERTMWWRTHTTLNTLRRLIERKLIAELLPLARLVQNEPL